MRVTRLDKATLDFGPLQSAHLPRRTDAEKIQSGSEHADNPLHHCETGRCNLWIILANEA